jgi:alkanesulfonate monooxygenase SsuD/methylene tetrahydromethanopterin reductase-like flavin-dependent oxidoreductase (luciferase family)
VRDLAQAAEALGFDAVWVSDHVVIPATSASAYPYSPDGAFRLGPRAPYFEPLTALTYLAGCTSRVRLGTHVLILPYRHPVVTAKMLATLDVLSGGRLDLGIGAGWMAEEFAALAAPPFERRGAVTDEQVRMARGMGEAPVASPALYSLRSDVILNAAALDQRRTIRRRGDAEIQAVHVAPHAGDGGVGRVRGAPHAPLQGRDRRGPGRGGGPHAPLPGDRLPRAGA